MFANSSICPKLFAERTNLIYGLSRENANCGYCRAGRRMLGRVHTAAVDKNTARARSAYPLFDEAGGLCNGPNPVCFPNRTAPSY